MAPDRRSEPRYYVDLEVDYGAEENYLFAYIKDISALGIFIQTLDPESPGTRLNLRFVTPSVADPFVVDGEVVWINAFRPGDITNINPGMGIRFLNLDEAVREQLMDLVRRIAYLDSEQIEIAQAIKAYRLRS